MEQYGITELARLFGISTEAIRKYEAKGLLESVRDENNQFRKYDIWDIGMLAQIRAMRKLDFTIQETEQLLRDGELSKAEEVMRKKKEEIADLILKYQGQFQFLEQAERNFHDLASRGSEFWLEYRPAFYGFDIFDRTSLTADISIPIDKWLEHTPLVFLAGVFGSSGSYQRSILAVEERNAGWLDKDGQGKLLQYFPAHLCACMMLGESYGNLIEEPLQAQIALIEQQGYQVSGDIVAKVSFMSKKEESYYGYHRVWIPIEKA